VARKRADPDARGGLRPRLELSRPPRPRPPPRPVRLLQDRGAAGWGGAAAAGGGAL